MKRIKLSFYLLMIFTISGLSANIYSQNTGQKPGKTPEEIAKLRADKLNEIVTLTPSQYDQVYNLIVSHASKRQQLKEQYGTDKQGFRDAMKENMKSMREQMRTILTDEQKAKLKEHRKTMKQKRWDKKNDKHFNRNDKHFNRNRRQKDVPNQ